jgi:hypothetical protein
MLQCDFDITRVGYHLFRGRLWRLDWCAVTAFTSLRTHDTAITDPRMAQAPQYGTTGQQFSHLARLLVVYTNDFVEHFAALF